MNDLRSQLAPGWSGVNVALIALLFFVVGWPLALLMVAYVVWGRQLGLDLSRPETFAGFGARLKHAWTAATRSWGGGGTLSSGTPDAGAARPDPRDEATALRAEREALERDRREFERERRDWRDGAARAPGEDGAAARGPLDS